MSRPWPVLITLTFLSPSFAVCDSCTVAGEDQDGVNCTFRPDVCGWNITSGDAVKWRRKDGYMLWETKRIDGAEKGFFSSKQLCFTENRIYSLEFKYKINRASVCSLSVKLQCAQATRDPVWVGDHKVDNWLLTSPPLTISCPDSTFKIVFLAKKTSTSQRRKCQIRVDDIVYKYSGEDISLSPTTITSATAPTTALPASTLTTPEEVFQSSTATATVTPTTDVRIQPTSREAEGTTDGTSTHKTTDELDHLPNNEPASGDSDPELAIGIGAALFVVVGVVIFVVVVRLRRGKQSDGRVTCLRIPACLRRGGKPRLPQAERLRPAVHNSAYSTEDDQIILNGRRVSGCKGDDHAYELAKTQENTDYCNLSTAAPTTASVSVNATRLENTYFELEAEPPAGGNTRPGESLYEVTDGTEFEDHYSVPDDAKPVLGRGTVQSGDNLGYELAILPKTDIYCTPRNTDATKNPGAGNHTSSVHNQTTGVKDDEYNKLSRRNPRTDVRRNDDYHHLKKGGELKPSETGTAQYSMAQLQDEYNHLNEGGELKPGQIGIAEDEYSHLTQEQDRQKPAQLATSEYCVAKPTESGVTDRHTNERATNYVNVSLTDNATEDEYNRLDFEKNPSLPAAGKCSGGGGEGGEYNHLKAESCQNQDDEYNNLNFRRSDQPSEKGQGSDVYNRLSNDRT